MERYKDGVRCEVLGADVPGLLQEQLMQTLIVHLLRTHLISLINLGRFSDPTLISTVSEAQEFINGSAAGVSPPKTKETNDLTHHTKKRKLPENGTYPHLDVFPNSAQDYGYPGKF